MPITIGRKSMPGYPRFSPCRITELRTLLNGGVLPEGYYALAGASYSTIGPDVLTCRPSKDILAIKGPVAVALFRQATKVRILPGA